MADSNGITITSVKFNEYKKGAMRAWAAVTFNGVMTLEGFKVFEKDGRSWVNVPSDQKDDKWYDRIRFPKDWYQKGFTNPILEAVLQEWTNLQNGTVNTTSDPVATEDDPW